MKDIIRILILVTVIAILTNCSQNKPPQNNKQLFTTEQKEQCIDILKAYQKVDAEYLKQVKQHSAELKELQTYSENSIDNNIVLIDSVASQAIGLINEDKFEDLMELLDDNKMNFYSHPNNNVLWLMGEFNALLDVLYSEYLPKEEGLKKIIEIHELRKLFFEGVIGFNGNNYKENKQAYDSAYKEELEYLIDLYNSTGNCEDKIEGIKKILSLLE